jgi:hypothetical protein
MSEIDKAALAEEILSKKKYVQANITEETKYLLVRKVRKVKGNPKIGVTESIKEAIDHYLNCNEGV